MLTIPCENPSHPTSRWSLRLDWNISYIISKPLCGNHVSDAGGYRKCTDPCVFVWDQLIGTVRYSWHQLLTTEFSTQYPCCFPLKYLQILKSRCIYWEAKWLQIWCLVYWTIICQWSKEKKRHLKGEQDYFY